MSDADDRRQLQDVMLSYAAAVDDRDMARYRACFSDDVEIVGFGEATITGADTWTASVESQLGAFSATQHLICLLYTSPSPRDQRGSRMPSSA